MPYFKNLLQEVTEKLPIGYNGPELLNEWEIPGKEHASHAWETAKGVAKTGLDHASRFGSYWCRIS